MPAARYRFLSLAGIDAFSREVVHWKVCTNLTGPTHTRFYAELLNKTRRLPDTTVADMAKAWSGVEDIIRSFHGGHNPSWMTTVAGQQLPRRSFHAVPSFRNTVSQGAQELMHRGSPFSVLLIFLIVRCPQWCPPLTPPCVLPRERQNEFHSIHPARREASPRALAIPKRPVGRVPRPREPWAPAGWRLFKQAGLVVLAHSLLHEGGGGVQAILSRKISANETAIHEKPALPTGVSDARGVVSLLQQSRQEGVQEASPHRVRCRHGPVVSSIPRAACTRRRPRAYCCGARRSRPPT